MFSQKDTDVISFLFNLNPIIFESALKKNSLFLRADGRSSRNGSQQLGSRSSSRDSSLHDSSRSQSMSMPPPQPIKSIPPPTPASTPSKPASSMTEEQIAKKSANILEEYLSDTNVIVSISIPNILL